MLNHTLDDHDESHDESHDHDELEDHDHDGEVFSHFDVWISAPSIVMLVFVILLGSLANIFIIHCIYKRKIGTKVINPILIAISAKNLFAITTCIPVAAAMLSYPDIIKEITCHIQETITFSVLFGGFLYPALLSAVQCDSTYRPFGTVRRPVTIHVTTAVVTIVTVGLGVQNLYNTADPHGCHLWSRRVDAVLLSYVYSIGVAAIVSFLVMGTSYYLIYRRTSAHEQTTTSVMDNALQAAGNSAWNSTLGQSTSRDNRKCQPVRRRSTTILKPMFCIVITNLLFSLPWQLLYSLMLDGRLDEMFDELRIVTMCILYIPIATDPVIFLTFSSKGRTAVKSFFRRSRVVPVGHATRATLVSQTY